MVLHCIRIAAAQSSRRLLMMPGSVER
jgi:hypothetical protein